MRLENLDKMSFVEWFIPDAVVLNTFSSAPLEISMSLDIVVRSQVIAFAVIEPSLQSLEFHLFLAPRASFLQTLYFSINCLPCLTCHSLFTLLLSSVAGFCCFNLFLNSA